LDQRNGALIDAGDGRAAFKRAQQFDYIAESVRRIDRDRAHQRRVEPGRQFGPRLARGLKRAEARAAEGLDLAIGIDPREDAPESDAEGELVGALVAKIAAEHLRREIA